MALLHGETNSTQLAVIGNAAPVQDRASGRVVVPFCRNNSQVFLTYSDDSGASWAPVTMVREGRAVLFLVHVLYARAWMVAV